MLVLSCKFGESAEGAKRKKSVWVKGYCWPIDIGRYSQDNTVYIESDHSPGSLVPTPYLVRYPGSTEVELINLIVVN